MIKRLVVSPYASLWQGGEAQNDGKFPGGVVFKGFFWGFCFKWERVILQDAVPAQRQKERKSMDTEEQPFLNAACYKLMLCERDSHRGKETYQIYLLEVWEAL